MAEAGRDGWHESPELKDAMTEKFVSGIEEVDVGSDVASGGQVDDEMGLAAAAAAAEAAVAAMAEPAEMEQTPLSEAVAGAASAAVGAVEEAANADAGMASTVEEEEGEPQPLLTEKEIQEHLAEAVKAKERGNEMFRKRDFEDAIGAYTEAIALAPPDHADSAPFYMNRAAALFYTEKYKQVVEDAGRAIELKPDYVKAYLRRAAAHEKLEEYASAEADFKKVLELDSHNDAARSACRRLAPLAEAERERTKEEMMGKLKELGNMCLKPFGLSTSNFQFTQDPNSGGYSMNFVNNPS